MYFPRVSLFLRLCAERVRKGKGSYAHAHAAAASQKYTGIMRADRAELSLHITIILSFAQLPQHLP